MTATGRRPGLAGLAPWIAIAFVLYAAIRARRDLVDFEVYRTAAIRAEASEPLYRPDDGHYQFKYLPAFAVLMAPIAWGNAEATKAIWFGLDGALLLAFFQLSAS